MRIRSIAAVAATAAVAAAGIAAASPASHHHDERLDDGKDLVAPGQVGLAAATAAATDAYPGATNETDLEHWRGRLVYNVDVGNRDVKVDATTGRVLGAASDR